MGQIRLIKSLVIWTVLGLLAAALQTTVWPMFVGDTAAPQLWLNFVLYFIMFRPMMQALGIAYALGLLWAPFTSLSLGVYWAAWLALVPVASTVKSRTFWPGARYFMIASFCLAVGWHLASFALSQAIERNPADLHLLTRLTEIMLTPFAAIPQFYVMQWLDRFDQDEPAPHFGRIEE